MFVAMKRRKPDSWVQVNLRIKEELRLKLEREAKQHQVSFNRELITRLQDSLDTKARQSLEGIAADMERSWSRFRELLWPSE